MAAKSSQSARATISRKTLPADALTDLAPKGSAQPSSTARAGAPAAAAVRQIAPTFPGSCTRSSTTRGQPASRAAAIASSAVDSRTLAIARTPCGVTVWLIERNTSRASITCRAASAPNWSPSRPAMTSSSTPDATASATTRGPSRRAKPGSRRRARRRNLRTTSFSGLMIGWLEAFLCNLHQPGKGTAVAHGQVSQHLAVDLHSGLAKAVHELAVRQSRLPRGGVDSRDPELPHLSLAPPPVAERVSDRVQDSLIGWAEEELLRKPEALCSVEDRLVAPVGRNPALDSCHLRSPAPCALPYGLPWTLAARFRSCAFASWTCARAGGSSRRLRA